MKGKLVIFDLDGTILDTIYDIHKAIIETIKFYGFPIFDIDTTKKYVGDGIKKLVERAVGKDNFKDEHEKFFRSFYRDHIVDNTKLFEGIQDLLSDLKRSGNDIVILSNKSFDMTDYLVRYFHLDRFTSLWCGGDSFCEKKPSPLPVKEIIATKGVCSDMAIVIGDNYTDIECGVNAGLKTIYCKYGYGKLSDVSPDYIVESPIEIKGILGV